MKPHKALWRPLCWAVAILLLNAALSTCLSYEPKVENVPDEPDEPDTTAAAAVVDTVPMPIFKEDPLAPAGAEEAGAAAAGLVPAAGATAAAGALTAPEIPTELTFRDSALADTLYARKKTEQPFYTKWWFFAAVAGAVTATVVAIASGGDEGEEDLPEFPDPPGN